jgi:hypothetical protein
VLGWTVTDLFGLHQPTDKPHPSYQRLSRYDCTGLIWLLRGAPAVALTDNAAAIQNPFGSIAVYRRPHSIDRTSATPQRRMGHFSEFESSNLEGATDVD